MWLKSCNFLSKKTEKIRRFLYFNLAGLHDWKSDALIINNYNSMKLVNCPRAWLARNCSFIAWNRNAIMHYDNYFYRKWEGVLQDFFDIFSHESTHLGSWTNLHITSYSRRFSSFKFEIYFIRQYFLEKSKILVTLYLVKPFLKSWRIVSQYINGSQYTVHIT